VGAGPLFLRKGSTSITPIQPQIESRLASAEPDVEVLLAEVVGGGTLRVFIDHPDGVTLALCERVTMLLNDLREHYTLEVSSPGSRRPLTISASMVWATRARRSWLSRRRAAIIASAAGAPRVTAVAVGV